MNAIARAQQQSWRTKYFNLGALSFWGVHIAAVIGAVMVGISWSAVLLTAAVYVAGMFFVTGVYHRYFSHRTYKTSRAFQFVLGLLAQCTTQKGILWWSHHHRHHHRASDQPDDLHSPAHGGFWWSHHGWILCDNFESTDYSKIKDFARYPELVFLNKTHLLYPIAYGVISYLIGGSFGLVWGFFVPTVFLWHGTFTINSLSHVWGSRRYETTDTSRNNFVLALITLGEGWHNNHHHYQASCKQGFRWYEIDITYYILRALAAVGLIWDIKTAPAHVIENRPNDKATQLGVERPQAAPSLSAKRAA